MRSRTPAALSASILLLGAPATVLVAPAAAQDQFVQRVNDLYAGPDRAVPQARRSDLLLIPALAAMQRPPQPVATPLRAMLVSPGDASWNDAVAWATAPSQQAVLEQIVKAGEPGRGFAFLLPYGEQNASPEARSAGLVVRLGDPALLATAKFEYLGRLTDAASLVHIEATRLAHEKEAMRAADLLIAWTGIARQIVDREFFVEKRWGLRHSVATLERLRDLVHEHADQFTGANLADLVTDLSEDNLAISRLQLPRADRIAGEQILARAFVERQGVNSEFGSIMARIGAGDRPLRQFGEAARWQTAGDTHAGTFETGDALRGVFGDWDYRWRLPEFDKVRAQSTEFDRIDRKKFAMVAAVADGVQEMFSLRQRLRAEAEGARLSLAVMGFKADNRTFPASLAAVRPRYVRTVGADPYSERGQEFHYFVPIRDQPRGARELPKPHEVAFQLPPEVQLASQDPFASVGMSRAAMSSLRRFQEESRSAAAGLEQMRASIDQMRASLQSAPAQVRQEAQSSIEMLSLAVTFGQRLNESDEVKRIAGLTNPDSVPQSEANAMLEAVAARAAALHQEILAAASPESRAAMEAHMAAQRASIQLSLTDASFVLYSAGPDQSRDWARRVGHGAPDLLLWPPAITVVRDRFRESGADLTEITPELLWITADQPARGSEPSTGAQASQPAQQRPASPPGGAPF